MDEFAQSLKSIGLTQLCKAALLAAICFLVCKLLLTLLRKFFEKHEAIPDKVQKISLRGSRFLLVSISIIYVCDKAGLPTTLFTALVSITAVAVSLAVQGMLANLVSGVIISTTQPFRVGDIIENKSGVGTVRDVGAISTKVERPDGTLAIIPNNDLQKESIVNYSTLKRRRMAIEIGMEYDTHPSAVRKALLEAAHMTKGVLDDPAPEVVLTKYGDYWICYTMFAWAKSEELKIVEFRLNEVIYDVFAKYHLEFPYPKMTLLRPEQMPAVSTSPTKEAEGARGVLEAGEAPSPLTERSLLKTPEELSETPSPAAEKPVDLLKKDPYRPWKNNRQKASEKQK